MWGRMNLPDNSEGASLNVFAQATEPETKDGIWIDTSNIDDFEYDGVEITNTDYYLHTQLADIPYDFYGGSAVSIGTNIFLFGGKTSGNYRKAYKYDIETDIYTQLADIPYDFYYGSAVSIGTNIFLFGSQASGDTRKAYKYDIETDIYTQLEDIPYDFYGGSAVSIGTNVFLFGSFTPGDYRTAYKYDIEIDIYTQLADIPYYFSFGSAVAIETNVFLFGSYTSGNYRTAYKITNRAGFRNNIIYIYWRRNSSTVFTVKLSEKLTIQLDFHRVYIFKNNIIQRYPAYYGDGTQWLPLAS